MSNEIPPADRVREDWRKDPNKEYKRLQVQADRFGATELQRLTQLGWTPEARGTDPEWVRYDANASGPYDPEALFVLIFTRPKPT